MTQDALLNAAAHDSLYFEFEFDFDFEQQQGILAAAV